MGAVDEIQITSIADLKAAFGVIDPTPTAPVRRRSMHFAGLGALELCPCGNPASSHFATTGHPFTPNVVKPINIAVD